jgi:hypothetical protein
MGVAGNTMKKPKLTLAMATYDDFYGVYATVQGIRAFNSIPALEQTEILVLDNNPEGQHASGCKDLARDVGIRYEQFKESTGTSATRQKLVELARGEYVLVMDCHVNFQPNFLDDLIRYVKYDADPKDLYTGPIVYDRFWKNLTWRDPVPTWTHWEYVWCNGMLGMWSTIWDKPGHPSMASGRVMGLLRLREYVPTGSRAEWAMTTEDALNEVQYMQAQGYTQRTGIYEIPAMGLGVFLTSKEHWLGFHPDHKEFGGEEWYIHEKYRKARRKCVSLPFLAWNHRFLRPDGIKYPISEEGKMRNNYLHFQELGGDLSEVHQHFVVDYHVAEKEWDKLVVDPVKYNPKDAYPPNTRPDNTKAAEFSQNGLPLPNNQESLFSMAMEMGSMGLNVCTDFARELMDYASKASVAMEVSDTRESTLFIAAGMKRRTSGEQSATAALLSIQSHEDYLLNLVNHAIQRAPGRSLSWFQVNGKTVQSEVAQWMPENVDTVFLVNPDQEVVTFVGNQESVKRMVIAHSLPQAVLESDIWQVTTEITRQNGTLYICERKPLPGPGTRLKGVLGKLGIRVTPECPCNEIAAIMDQMGNEWCLRHQHLLVTKIQEEARKRWLLWAARPFVITWLIRKVCR